MKPIILVVDDASTDQHVVGGLLNAGSHFDVEFAWDGEDALRRLAQSRVDVVVTDLIMPGVDGLELVETMTESYPDVPVCLMTAFGNEDIAADALCRGALSYVPKSQLAERLVVEITRLVNRAMADRCRNFAASRLSDTHLSYTLENDPFMIEPVVHALQRTMASMNVGTTASRMRACIALEEAISNAILHGNLDISRDELSELRGNPHLLDRVVQFRRYSMPFRDRRVHVDATINREFAKFVVRDNGVGFDLNDNLTRDLVDYFDRGQGRGLNLMHALSDDIQFNGPANEVAMSQVA